MNDFRPHFPPSETRAMLSTLFDAIPIVRDECQLVYHLNVTLMEIIEFFGVTSGRQHSQMTENVNGICLESEIGFSLLAFFEFYLEFKWPAFTMDVDRWQSFDLRLNMSFCWTMADLIKFQKRLLSMRPPLWMLSSRDSLGRSFVPATSICGELE